MDLTNFTDEQLIQRYYDLAGEKLRLRMIDWTDGKKWKEIVSGLAKSVQLVYRIGILNMQVMNGGFLQYFDNRYGIFAYQTLDDLKLVGAIETEKILAQALLIINPNDYKNDRFFDYIFLHKYNPDWERIADTFDEQQLDNKYYELDRKENLELLIAAYLRNNP
jgi:hypothetical protein